jgi:predicted aminopeptidase
MLHAKQKQPQNLGRHRPRTREFSRWLSALSAKCWDRCGKFVLGAFARRARSFAQSSLASVGVHVPQPHSALAIQLALLSLLLLCPSLHGCYFAELGARQLALINDQTPLPVAIDREGDSERRALLSIVPDLRAFARNKVQLPVRGSYAGYYATEDTGILFVLVASRRTAFEPYTWWFPIVGRVSYKSFVDEADARRAGSELEAEGYDTWVGRVTAYSTLGFFRDPVTTVMMRKGAVGFIEVLLHEMAHQKLYVRGHTDWNEQLASFVGRTAAAQYVQARYADQPALLAELAAREERRERSDRLLQGTLAQLDALYASGRSEREILRERAPVFAQLQAELRRLHPEQDASDIEINNAHLLQYRRYLLGSEQLEALWAEAHASWPKFWQLCEAYAHSL